MLEAAMLAVIGCCCVRWFGPAKSLIDAVPAAAFLPLGWPSCLGQGVKPPTVVSGAGIRLEQAFQDIYFEFYITSYVIVYTVSTIVYCVSWS